MSLTKHADYHEQKIDLLKHRALYFDTEYIHAPI